MSGAHRIRVFGGDIVALAAAIAYKRALPRAEVTLIGGEDDMAQPQYGAAGPILADFHRKIGLDARLFETAARPVETRVSRFGNWGGARLSFGVPERGREPFADGAALHQLWLRREDAGDAPQPETLLDDRSAPPGYRFDAAGYRDLLRRMAGAIGIEQPSEPDGEACALELDCRPYPQADRTTSDWEDWSDFLPSFDAVDLQGAPTVQQAAEQISEQGGRLLLRIGQQSATFAPAERRSGRAAQPWQGKRIAFGQAAIDVPPLYGLALSTALADILRAIRLLPPEGALDAVRGEYNRQTTAAHVATLEWASAPFLLGAWASIMPPGLTAIVEQFRHRGRLPLREGDPVSRGQWLALLIGCGLRPERIDPTALLPTDQAADRMLAAALS
ncbi:tryptophan 7-halogenase [Novosphingopyxis sp.]|uniref:tryptophan 7-halogenase n=1 Tax=Novosphingopyxis sp. TaxID=2709690 RepID=UPI003B5BDB71